MVDFVINFVHNLMIMMSADREKAEAEEAAAMARQMTAMGFSVEIEDRNSLVGINFNEHYQTQDYKNARHQHEGSIKMLGVDPLSFPFLGQDPSPMGKTKMEMFCVSFPNHRFDDNTMLYVTPSIEYYSSGICFNKVTRRWSLCQDYVLRIAESFSQIPVQNN
jgi:hypothetical protein